MVDFPSEDAGMILAHSEGIDSCNAVHFSLHRNLCKRPMGWGAPVKMSWQADRRIGFGCNRLQAVFRSDRPERTCSEIAQRSLIYRGQDDLRSAEFGIQSGRVSYVRVSNSK